MIASTRRVRSGRAIFNQFKSSGAKGSGQQFFHRGFQSGSVPSHPQKYQRLQTEFRQHLPAGPAGRAAIFRGNRDGSELAFTLGDSFEYRHAFSAHGGGVSRIFNIHAFVDLAGGGQQRRSHRIMRVRRICPFADING